MSCNHCSTKFNFFHKEVSCGNCKLSFCNKCVKQKTKVPARGNAEFNVCRTCFATLTAGSSTNQNVPPPDAFLKRMEAIETPVAPAITAQKTDQKLTNFRKGLSTADQQLLNRLEKLKDDGKGPAPSEVEIRKRLAALKGENNYVEGPSKQQAYTPDLRSDQQKADDLLDYFINEREIDLSHNPQEEIEARLASLREQGVRPNEGAYISNLHDSSSSEEEIDRMTKKIMDEVALEEKCAISIPKNSSNSTLGDDEKDGTSSPELPWCVLCNNDAKFRCLDCDGDLYCASCNKEVHKNWGDTDHSVVVYKRN